MFERLYTKLDVATGATVSGSLLSTPLWLAALSDWLQVITLVVGITVGVSAYRLNTARRESLQEDGHE